MASFLPLVLASSWFKPWLAVVCKMPCVHRGYLLLWLHLVVAIRPQTDSTLDEHHEVYNSIISYENSMPLALDSSLNTPPKRLDD